MDAGRSRRESARVAKLDKRIYSDLCSDHPIDLCRYQVANGCMGRAGLISVFELRFGVARSAKPASLWARIQRDILGLFQVLPFTEQDALAAADLMAPLVAGGHNLALQDIWLAEVAFNHNLTFVTRNRRDFNCITGLKVENWFE